MDKAEALRRELIGSARWTAILLVPAGVAVTLLVGLLGGLEGGGKIVFLTAMAPMLLLQPLTDGLSEATAMCVAVLAEYVYLLLLVLIGRATWRLVRRL
jgi:hypothetical protein